ncbi:MAG: DUF2975 domain-containing protein [Caloramator sp.]|nr:DUF2975 domain-containing protein [Caloramator sp.]
MNQIKNFEKFKKITKALRIISQIFYTISIGGGVLSLLAAIFISILLKSPYILSPKSRLSFSITANNIVELKFDNALLSNVDVKPIIIFTLIMASVVLLIFASILKQTIQILRSVENDTPFAVENATRLNKIGIILIVSSFVIRIFEFLSANTLINSINLPNVTVNYSVDITMLFLGVLLLVLSGIFSYGNYLQKEYDETV